MASEFYSVQCPGEGYVSIDGSLQGKAAKGEQLLLLQTGTGAHDISMRCLDSAKRCRRSPIHVTISDTNPLDPAKIVFECP
jgi:hypothetical protein